MSNITGEYERIIYSDDVPVYISDETLVDIKNIMLGRVSIDGCNPNVYSLMHRMEIFGLGSDDSTVPDVIAVTLNTAVPVADAVRGMYEEAGVSTPPIIGIRANREKAFIHKIAPDAPEVKIEYERIARLTKGSKTSVIIDEFIDNGDTSRYAQTLMLRAGFETCSIVAGKWYQYISSSELDVPNLTSSYAKFMNEIGRDCYRAYKDIVN